VTLGDLSEEDLEGIRTGAAGDPTVGQVVALAGVFGVEPSYMLDQVIWFVNRPKYKTPFRRLQNSSRGE
jgi:hypothetical protein